jgi:hypothetical protein
MATSKSIDDGDARYAQCPRIPERGRGSLEVDGLANEQVGP